MAISIMSISAHFQQVSSRREGRRTKTRVASAVVWHVVTTKVKVFGLQSGVGGDQRRPRLAHEAQRGTAVPSRAGIYTPSRTAWRWRVAERPTSAVRRGGCASNPGRTAEYQWPSVVIRNRRPLHCNQHGCDMSIVVLFIFIESRCICPNL